jgi:hypothetical protein
MRHASSPIDHASPPRRLEIRAICGHFLLIAMMVQGITPDLHDLASTRVFHLLIQAAHPSRFWQDEGTLHGEVSGPAGIPDSDRIQRQAEQARSVRFLPIIPIVAEVRSGAIHVPHPFGTRPGSDPPLIYRLCRLAC